MERWWRDETSPKKENVDCKLSTKKFSSFLVLSLTNNCNYIYTREITESELQQNPQSAETIILFPAKKISKIFCNILLYAVGLVTYLE